MISGFMSNPGASAGTIPGSLIYNGSRLLFRLRFIAYLLSLAELKISFDFKQDAY